MPLPVLTKVRVGTRTLITAVECVAHYSLVQRAAHALVVLRVAPFACPSPARHQKNPIGPSLFQRFSPGPRQRGSAQLPARCGSGVGWNRENSLEGLGPYHENISVALTLTVQLCAPCC